MMLPCSQQGCKYPVLAIACRNNRQKQSWGANQFPTALLVMRACWYSGALCCPQLQQLSGDVFEVPSRSMLEKMEKESGADCPL